MVDARQLFRRKPIDRIDEPQPDSGLRPTLGLWQLTAIGVGGIIGAGIFTLAGKVAHGDPSIGLPAAGPAVVVSFLLAGLASAAAALSYAEFAGMIPRAGSAYTYGYAVLGEIVGWCIGWDLLLEYTAIVAVVAIGISGYITFLVDRSGLGLPLWMLGAPGTEPPGTPAGSYKFDVFAAVLCLLIAFALTRGLRYAARWESMAVIIKIVIVAIVVAFGITHVDMANFHPFAPSGFGGIMSGSSLVFFAVFGYDAMSTAAEESTNSTRYMPKAIILSLVISMALYVVACLVLTGMQSYRAIDPQNGFASAFLTVGDAPIADIVAAGAIVGILTVIFTFMLGATRIWYSMSRDGLLPAWFAHTDPKRGQPTRVTWLVGGVSAVIAGLLPIGQAAELTNIGILLAFVVVCTAVIVLRYRRPTLPRTFRTPGMPLVPLAGVGFSLYLVTFLSHTTFLRFAIWFALGMCVYFGYSRRHSALAQGFE